MRLVNLLVSLCGLAGCKVYDPLFCENSSDCTDPARPFCDVNGDYPESEGIGKTCIPSPSDAGVGTPDAGQGGSDGGFSTDASQRCTWTPLTKLARVNTSALEGSGSLNSDGLNLYFARTIGEAGDIFLATREDAGQAFGEPILVDELKDGRKKISPDISASELELFYRVNVDGTNDAIERALRGSPTGIFETPEPTGIERESADEPFGTPVPLEEGFFLSDEGVYDSARWNGDQTQMVTSFGSGTAFDLYYSVCQ